MLVRLQNELEGLVEEMLNKIPQKYFKSKTATFLDPAMGSGQFVSAIEKRLRKEGHSDENIRHRVFGIEQSWRVKIAKNRHNLVGTYEIADFLEDDILIKPTVTIGNPPFSNTEAKTGKRGGSSKLYDRFFALAVELSEVVVMIMPATDKWKKNKHNDLLRDKANHITKIPDSMFPTVHIPMWYVVSDGSDIVPDINWMGYNEMPEQIYGWVKGKLHVTNDGHLLKRKHSNSDNDVTIYHKISERDGLVTYYANVRNVKPQALFPDKGYAVLMPQQINVNRGWTKTEIVKCDGMQAGMNGMNIAFVDTKREAKELVELMKTQEFINQAVMNMGGMNNMTQNAMMSIDMNKVIEAS